MDRLVASDIVLNCAAEGVYVAEDKINPEMVLDHTSALELNFALRQRLQSNVPNLSRTNLAHMGETLADVSARIQALTNDA